MFVTPAREKEPHAGSGAASGLSTLRSVQLNLQSRQLLDAAAQANGGDAAWRVRKLAEARALLALAQIAPPGRLTVQMVDLREHVRVLLLMRVPVACHPDENNVLRVAQHALLGVVYPREALHENLPGSRFVQILQPVAVWHANVVPGEQALCLGITIPCNTPLREIVLMAYDALAMTTHQVNEADEAGVFHVEAARWWAANLDRLPLSKTPFLKSEDDAQ